MYPNLFEKRKAVEMKKKLAALLLSFGMVTNMAMPLFAFPLEGYSLMMSEETESTDDVGFLVPVEQQTEVPEGYIGIYTAEDLDNVRNDLGANYILMNDIDLSGYENWVPIGTEDYVTTYSFFGTFNGNGYEIQNLTMSFQDVVDGNSEYDGNNYFLAFIVSNLGTINNLKLNVNYKISNYNSRIDIGGIVCNSIGGTISNCIVDGIITGEKSNENSSVTMGGIISNYYGGLIENCLNLANIDYQNTAGGSYWDYIGGIIGEIDTASSCGVMEVNSCINEGNLNIKSFTIAAGGIVGNVSSGVNTTTDIICCKNNGDIDTSLGTEGYAQIGGIIGMMYLMSQDVVINVQCNANIGDFTIYGSENEMTSLFCGGICGYQSIDDSKNNIKIYVDNCYNTGNTYASNNIANECYGGIIGNMYTYTNDNNNKISIINNYNIGELPAIEDGKYRECGGIVGSCNISKGTFSSVNHCYYNNQNLKTVGTESGCQIEGSSYLSESEMHSASSFVGFDFDTVWEIGVTEGYLYPTLRDNPHNGNSKPSVTYPPTVLTVEPGTGETVTRFTWDTEWGTAEKFILKVTDSTGHVAEGVTSLPFITMPLTPETYTARVYVYYADGTVIASNTVEFTVGDEVVTSSISTTFDTTAITLAEGETFDFAGIVSTTAESGLEAVQIDIHKYGDDGIGITHFRTDNTDEENPLTGNTFDLSAIPSFTGGDTLTGQTDNTITLSAGTSWNVYLYAKDTDGNTLGGSVIKRIDIVEAAETEPVHASIECTDPDDYAGNYRDFTITFDVLPTSAYLQFDNQHNPDEWLSDEYCSTNPAFMIAVEEVVDTGDGYEYNTSFIIHSEGLESNDYARKVQVAIPTANGVIYSEAFTFYVNPIPEYPQTTMGIAYEQTLDISDDTVPPAINAVKVAKKQDKNTKEYYYRLSILTFTADEDANIFFFWETDGGEFQKVDNEYMEVDFIPDGTNTVTAYMGDGLGWVASYELAPIKE